MVVGCGHNMKKISEDWQADKQRKTDREACNLIGYIDRQVSVRPSGVGGWMKVEEFKKEERILINIYLESVICSQDVEGVGRSNLWAQKAQKAP